jgi:single-strand DNA-binding protein
MMLVGLARLGRDCEIRYTPEGTAVANLSLAFNYGKKDNEGHRPTQWISASLWGERAEKLTEYLLKGTLLHIALDDIHVETYERKEGGTGNTLKARVNSLEFAGGKREDGDKPTLGKPATGSGSAVGITPPQQVQGSKKGAGSFADMDDDIPFDNPYKGFKSYVV